MEADYAIIKFKNISDSGGFFSNYFSVLSTMIAVTRKGLIPYVDASSTWFNPTCNFENNTVEDPTINPWNWWFTQSANPSRTKYEVLIYRDFLIHNPLKFTYQPNLERAKALAAGFCTVRPEILSKVEALYEANIKGKVTLGVLARGTEMLHHHLEYPKVESSRWPELINAYVKEYPKIENIFLVSDDITVINLVREKFTNVTYLPDFFRRTDQSEEAFKDAHKPWWLTSPTGDPNHRQRVGEETLIQALLLAKCDHFLGSCSGISNGVQFFNNRAFKSCKVL